MDCKQQLNVVWFRLDPSSTGEWVVRIGKHNISYMRQLRHIHKIERLRNTPPELNNSTAPYWGRNAFFVMSVNCLMTSAMVKQYTAMLWHLFKSFQIVPFHSWMIYTRFAHDYTMTIWSTHIVIGYTWSIHMIHLMTLSLSSILTTFIEFPHVRVRPYGYEYYLSPSGTPFQQPIYIHKTLHTKKKKVPVSNFSYSVCDAGHSLVTLLYSGTCGIIRDSHHWFTAISNTRETRQTESTAGINKCIEIKARLVMEIFPILAKIR